MFFITVFDDEVLDACVWHLELGALVLVVVVQSTAVPALDFALECAVFLWTATLNECKPLAIWITHALQPWRT